MRHVLVSLGAVAVLCAAVVLPAEGQSSRGSGSQADVVAAAFTAEVTGKVQSVDPSSGVMTLQTVDGPVSVRFPPPAVQAIKPGDTVTVAFGLVKPPPSASPQTSPGSSGSGSSGSGSSGSGSTK
jgi:hypothetical protein